MSKEARDKRRNNLWQTKSQKKMNVNEVKALKPSKHYRTSLEPLLQCRIIIKSDSWSCCSDTVDGIPCTKIFMRNAEVISIPAHKKNLVSLPIIVHHLWTVVDADWVQRASPKRGEPLFIKGFLYEYGSRGERNIGLQTLCAYTE